ncbi:MAG: pyridoxamine 5'-phosphate oxidase family protein [Actinomycetota bacterium]|nr:pyridoxamine 5'-phosphate oxidase family protein [Actinomycetota bacterium]
MASARVCHLATTRTDGTPHVVPISAVLDLDRLVFATEIGTMKVRNIHANPFVAICFDQYDEDWTLLKQVLLYGAPYFIETGMEFERDRNLLYEKYPQYESSAPIEEGASVIVEVEIERASTWGFG